MVFVIGLMGVSKSGKDTAASIIDKFLDGKRNVQIVAFAEPLKYAASHMCGFSYNQLYDQDFKETVDTRYGFTPRDTLVALGDAMRGLKEDFFLVRLKQRVDNLPENTVVIISDVRFANEAEFVKKELGGVVWGVNRPGLTIGAHKSESGVDLSLADLVIQNDGTMGQFREKVLDQTKKSGLFK